MVALNHATTGALIGLSVHNVPLALVLAILSHFVLDAIPHYDPAANEGKSIDTNWFRARLLVDALLCGLLVLVLWLSGSSAWLLASLCAFLATSPDFMWAGQFIRAQKGQDSERPNDPIRSFHANIQWKTGPWFWRVELIWLMASLLLLWNILR